MAVQGNGPSDYLSLGNWNARCYRCNDKHKASELKREWEGFYVCVRCWEPRQPQDFVRGIQDIQTVPWSQNPGDLFASFCTPAGLSAVPGWAQPSCAVPSRAPAPYLHLGSPYPGYAEPAN
jgi:hypothetical protein